MRKVRVTLTLLSFFLGTVMALIPDISVSRTQRHLEILALPLFAMCFFHPMEAIADFVPSTVRVAKASEEKVTSKVQMDFSIARGKPESVMIGLFGNEAPTATNFFMNVCEGKAGMQGLSFDGAQVSKIVKDEFIEVNKVSLSSFTILYIRIHSSLHLYQFALGGNLQQETYRSESGVTRIRSIDLAAKLKLPDLVNGNDLSHDVPGIISMRRGGGNFGFTIAPGPNEVGLIVDSNLESGHEV